MDIRFLVVDDQTSVAGAISSTLRQIGFDDVTMAFGVNEAWALFKHRPPDVIVSDQFMKDGTGLELCERIRDFEAGGIGSPEFFAGSLGEILDAGREEPKQDTARTGFMLVTGRPTRALVMEAKRSGVDSILAKPVSQDDLQARLSQLFGTDVRRKAS